MSWVEGVVCIAAIIGLCAIFDFICVTVRYWLGQRPRLRDRYEHPAAPPYRNPTTPPGAE